MKYKIQITNDAKIDLKSIYNYISLVLQVPHTAKNILNEISIKIDNLETLPEKYMIYPYEPLKTLQIRYFIVKKYCVFYKVDTQNKIVSIKRVVYSARDLKEQYFE